MILAFRLTFVGLLLAVLAMAHSTAAYAQQRAVELVASNELPDAPNPQTSGTTATDQSSSGTISGTVKDSSGAVIVGASIALKATASAANRRLESDGDGEFNFSIVDPGTYQITITAKGFAPWISSVVAVHEGEQVKLPPIVLQVATASSSISVRISQHEVAEEQIKQAEKQRLNGIFPEFYVSYVWNAASLSPGQKFELAWKTAIDPTTFAFAGAVAGYEQVRNNLRAYGQGVQGFSKRYGVNYADSFNSVMIGGAILPSLLHQDPRYFVKGTGSFQSRALHALSFPFITRSDRGHLQPNFSDILGTYASAEISNLYYPSSSQAHVTANNMLLGLGLDSANGLLLEFVYPHLTTSAPKKVAGNAQLVLHEGTPVSLALTEDLNAEDAQQGKTLIFALVEDIKVDGVTVAKAGSKASGQSIGAAKLSNDGKANELPIQFLFLQVGGEQVPLRSSKQRTGSEEDLYRLSIGAIAGTGSGGKIQIHAGATMTAHVATAVSLQPAQ